MGSHGSTPDVTHEDIRRLFLNDDHPTSPISISDVAATLACSEETARHRLEELSELGELQSKNVDGENRVWWLAGDDRFGDQHSQPEEFGTFVSAVKDYAIFKLDPDGVVVSWNDGAERIKGYAADDIIGEHFSTFYTDEDTAAGVPDENLEVAADEGRVEDEGWRVRKDGSKFWANVTITAVQDDDGELQGFTKVTRDMTERREYEEQLRQERDLTEQILETVPVSICLVSADGEFIRANQQMLHRLGIDADELGEYSVNSWDLYDTDGGPLPVEEWPWARVLDTGEPVHDYQCQVDLPGKGRRWLSLNAARIEDGHDDETRVVVSINDITEQKEHEEQLRRESNQTEKLLRTVPIAIAVQNAEGKTIMANQRAQNALGLSEEEILDEPDDADEWNLYDAAGEPVAPDETPSARVLATGEPVFDEELVFDPPSGDRLHFRVNAAPVFDPDGNLFRVITAGENITQLKRREQQLEHRKTELETELSEILDRISDAFYALDDEWRFTHLNDQAATLMQHSKEELLGQKVWDVFPDAADVYREQFQMAMDTQEPVTFEQHADELDAWLEFNAYPSESGLSIYFRDVTERKEREQELAKYQTIVETVKDGIYVKDEDGRFTMVNDAYAELTGYDQKELIGARASLVVDEATIDEARERKDTMATDEAADPTMEAPIETASGDRVPSEATFATIETANGDTQQVGVVRDISDRKEYERKIEESERRYRTLAENFPNGAVGLFDEDFRYTAVGGELLDSEDVDPDDRVGQSIYDLYPGDLIDEVEPYFAAALDGEANSFEVEYAGHHLYTHILPVRNAADEVDAGMLVVYDVTERREYQRQLEESNERLEQFAYAASHDLQEPLRMVSSYLQLIEDRYADALDEEGREFFEYAVDGADRMREMIDALLKYSRVETQGDPFEPMELETVFSDVQDDLKLQIEESDADITVGSLPTVQGDPGQLRQVFQNLLDNAIEYSGEGPPHIHIGAERNGDEWVISVRDEGIGIDLSDQDRIFDVFQRLHTREDHPGIGIGLALCQRIIERHNGDIWVESEPGEGSTFYVTLSAVDQNGE